MTGARSNRYYVNLGENLTEAIDYVLETNRL